MTIKVKKKKFKFTFGVFIRLAIFITIVFFSVNFLSRNIENKKNTVLGDKTDNLNIPTNLNPVYNLLPPDSKKQITNFSSASTSAFIQEKIEFLKQEAAGFPDKQIKEIQKQVVTNIYDNVINSIERK